MKNIIDVINDSSWNHKIYKDTIYLAGVARILTKIERGQVKRILLGKGRLKITDYRLLCPDFIKGLESFGKVSVTTYDTPRHGWDGCRFDINDALLVEVDKSKIDELKSFDIKSNFSITIRYKIKGGK